MLKAWLQEEGEVRGGLLLIESEASGSIWFHYPHQIPSLFRQNAFPLLLWFYLKNKNFNMNKNRYK